MSQKITKSELKQAFSAATTANAAADIKAISAVTPKIIMQGDTKAAFELVTMPSNNRREWMAEALSLFGTPHLVGKKSRKMVSSIYNPQSELKASEVLKLFYMSRRVGYLGFSFPIWRFVSQGFGQDHKALVEHFGMQRQTRDNDVRDASLPFSNPQRDELGTGYFWNAGRTSIEYRRSYIACSIHDPMSPITIVIRNSSYFYGRDRLPEAAYISFGYKTPDQIKNFKIEDITKENSNFAPLQDMLNVAAIPSTATRIKNLRLALDTLTAFDTRLSQWLTTKKDMPSLSPDFADIEQGTSAKGGRQYLAAFLDAQLERAQKTGKDTAPLYVGYIKSYQPAWHLKDVQPVTRTTAKDIKTNAPEGYKFVLLSGSQGDFPLGPKYDAPKSAQPKPKQG